METFAYSHFPADLANVHIALFTAVTNASQIRSRIVKASTMEGPQGDAEREAVNFAFIDAKLVTSKLCLLTALHQSMLSDVQKSLKTKTIHSEIIWSLNPTNNITEALRRFGVSDSSKSLLVVRVGSSADTAAVEKQMRAAVHGDLISLDALRSLTDWTAVNKVYKFGGDPVVVGAKADIARQHAVVDELVTSFVAMKSVMS